VWYIALQYPNWLLLGLVSGLGAGVGEVTSYLVGVWIGKSKKMTEGELGEKFYRLKLKLEKNPTAIPFLIFFAGATPLPDDMLLVPLGILKYPYKRVIFPCMLGKTVLCTIISLVGYLVGFKFPDLDQVFPISLIVPTEGVNPAADLISFSFVFWVIYLMVRLDFESIAVKKSKERKEFLQMILSGGSYSVDSLISQFDIQNTVNFRAFLKTLSENHSVVSFQDDLLVFDSAIGNNISSEISYEFGKWLLK
jgi:membrane protein YqaA with SNARE-associated domain